jgi:NADPH:quinone reductase-like Zn-dependent oxidoreductase
MSIGVRPCRIGGTPLCGFFPAEELTRPQPAMAGPLLATLPTRLASGELTPVIGQTGSWRDIDAMAHALLARGHKGKAVLRID